VKRTLRTTAAHEGQRLDHVLASWLPAALGAPLSRASLRRLVMAGAVSVNGRVLRRPGRPLRAGLRIEARVSVDRLQRGPADGDRSFVVSDADVLYRDDVLIAVDKPPGLPTVPTADPRRPSLVGAVKAFIAAERPDPGLTEPYLAVHQRLDRDTSGVVLFATDPAANPGLAAAFAGRAVEKTYQALTESPRERLPRRFTVDEPVGADGATAETELTVLKVLPRGLLVEARPRTGRKHQIRIHLAEAGAPILGDDRYAARGPSSVPRLMLHACRLALAHPLTGAPIVIESPLPADFRRALAGLAEPPARVAPESARPRPARGRRRPR
jgi:23S rRNA pseudouridine1911/1915/1917 synthase